MLIEKDEELDKLRGRNVISLDQSTDGENDENEKNLNLDYIKHVFIKYLQYQAQGNEKE